MKKAGIVTIIDYYNFGNRLQNYAISYLLNERMHCRAVTLEGYKSHPAKGRIPGWIKEQLALQICRVPFIARKFMSPGLIRAYHFSEWSRRRIPRTRYYFCEKLPREISNEFDLFFAGSDQIWNYRLKNLRLDDFFLAFAENEKKNSIAASFGVDRIPEEHRQYYCDRLSEFCHISVREETGAGIVKGLIGRDVPVLIDPVMMLSPDEWKSVEKKPWVDTSKQYVLKYYLGNGDAAIDRWAKDKGYAIYDLMNKNNKDLYSSGPGEFISLIRNANLICSDSFHCIAFSILFSRPFIVYERQGAEDYMLSRLETLLGKFSLENRWSHMLTEEEYLSCRFGAVEERLEYERKRFMDYLAEII